MSRWFKTIRVYSCPFVVLIFSALCTEAATFDEQRAAISASVETQPESAILDLLKAGIAEGKPTQAVAEAQRWLRQNLAEDTMLLYKAGRAAELSGDARGAAALYQQYLKVADPQAEPAGQAVTATHALLVDQLKDTSAAYAFNRGTLNRLAANPVARQFDQWFFEEAMRRKDVIAVANRLHALIKAGLANDLRVTHYDGYFRWVLQQADVYCEQPGVPPSTDELVAACKQLAATMAFNQEVALRLDWAVSVRAYNLAKVAEQEAAPPIAEAKALLEKYPRFARWVQTGWAGGGNGQYYRNDPKKYWPHEIDAKMAPIVAAAAKLTPLQLADLLASWRPRYYSDGTVRPIEVKAVRDYLAANPKVTNGRNGVVLLEKPWNQLTPEELQKLAPQVAQHPHYEASLIRAAAAAGAEKDFDKALAALIGPEAWRLPQHHDARNRDFGMLAKYCGAEPSDEARKKWGALGGGLKTEDAKKEDPPARRIAAFRKLWADYRSPQPKLPSVRERLVKTLPFTPEAIPDLLKDAHPEAALIAREAMEKGMSGTDPIWAELEAASKVNVSSYAPGILYLAQRHAGGKVAELKKRHPQKCKAHPLEPAMRKSVADALKQNNLESWQVLAWINMQYPEDNAEQVKLAQALVKSPLWKTMPFEVHFAVREWFKKDVMTPGEIALVDAADPELACRDLLALKKEPETAEEKKQREEAERNDPDAAAARAAEAAKADLAAAVPALQSTIDGLRNSPVRIVVPDAALENLGALGPAVFADPKAQELMLQIIDQLKAAPPAANFGYQLIDALIEKPDALVIHRGAPFFWLHIGRHTHRFSQVKELAQSLIDEHPSAASALASSGLEAVAHHRGHTYFKRETDIPLLKSIRGNAAMKMGLIVIPVAKNHPAFPVYQSQGDWITGNEDSAWDLLDENWEAFLPVHRELSMPYLKWALKRVIYGRDELRQESFIKALIGWAGEDASPLSLSEKVEIEIAYGDIAMQRGQLRQAHEIFSRTGSNEAYKELPIRHRATLRRASAERVAKNFDGALQTLNQLDLERVPELWTEIRYERAVVNYDMEEFDDAKDDIDSILIREPNHPDAKILLGKVQLKRQKLMEATEVELGSANSQKSIVPGEKLKVTLNDPTLAVSGAGTDIEVVVWATSGDKESFFLRQFGDEKTKFRGELPTALGAPTPGDKKLQVIGDDEIFYAYSERFRERMNDIAEQRGGPVTVASDAVIMASARKLLSEADQRVADMEKLMAELEAKKTRNAEQVAKARIAAESLDAEARAEGATDLEAEFKDRITRTVKPGNPINVRVIDPDRSRTAEIDELTVSVASSSGDSVSRVTLKETGTHTGWFEGRITTTGAQAMAFAENSEPGRNPNMVISPNADYPAWRPTAEKDTTPEFTIDLNDNVALGELTLTAAEAGARLENFIVQTAMNPQEWDTVASFPQNLALEDPWQPSVVVMNDTDHHHAAYPPKRSVHEDFDEIREHFNRGWMTQQFAQSWQKNVSGPTGAMPEAVIKDVEWKRQNRHSVSHVIYRFRAYFYEPKEVTRSFTLDLGKYEIPKETHSSISDKPEFMIAIDGRPMTEKDGSPFWDVNLSPGIHRIEIWATGWVNNMGFGRSCKLKANLEDPDYTTVCPDSFFDPETFPLELLTPRNGRAKLTANEDGTEFKVKFAPGSRGRLLRFVFLGQEGPVPAISRVTLSDPDGKKVLPVAEDFASLNKNDTLEILTGDKISVRYVDDRFVTDSKEKHERFLDVAFSNARVEFADMEPRWSGRHGKEMPFYEKLLRFPYDEPLNIAVHDADMDVSVEPDTVTLSLASGSGSSKQLIATETGPSTGVFKATVTPVGSPAKGAAQIQVAAGGTLTATYQDAENNRPGVPVDRFGKIVHARFVQPELRVSHATVSYFEAEYPGSPFDDATTRDQWRISNQLTSAKTPPEGGIALVHGRMAYLELQAPHLALRNSSTVKLYAQTDAGRAAVGGAAGAGFNIDAPGTIDLTGVLAVGWSGYEWRLLRGWQSRIYGGGHIEWGSENSKGSDRFRFSVPLVADVLPLRGVISEDERAKLRKQVETSRSAALILEQLGGGLVVRPGEQVHFGLRYKDGDGAEQWLTTSAKVVTHPRFSIMDEDLTEQLTSVYAGESLHLHVADLGADLTDASDTVTALIQAKSGAKARVELRETDPHSGIFVGAYTLSYAEKPGRLPEGYNVKRQGFPVTYGDTVAARYTDANGIKSPIQMVTISKGADGSIQPFSKQYEDPDVAMRTQFSLAEAYLEIAKRHRKLGETEVAAREYEQAKQLLASAMDQFRDPETRSHAEYLLGNLTLEEADTTEKGELKEDRYRAALSRFMKVTGSYSETLHASKAQFKIATIYEKLKEPEIAAQEYVKLAYKYPDSEFLATAMARLGSHFLKKAAGYEAKAKPLLVKEDDKDAQFEGEAMQKMAVREYLKTAQIFGRLQQRFPDHEMAGAAGLRAGQSYMRAGEITNALEAFNRVISEKGYDGKTVRSQAMYWSGKCQQDQGQQMAAYSIYKRLTYDFPESEWAAYARGQLSQPALLDLETELELERLEGGE